MRRSGLMVIVLLSVTLGVVAGPVSGDPWNFENSAQPTNLIATPTKEYVNLTWDAPLDDYDHTISSYLIYRNEGGHPYPDRAVLVATVDATTFSYRDESVIEGVEYTYYVVTKASDGVTSPHSNWVTVTVGATTPSAPNYLRAVPREGSVELSWLPPDRYGGVQITTYNVYRNSTVDDWNIIKYVSADTYNGMSLIDDGLTNGMNYTYTVRAVNAFGEGAVATVSVTPNYAPSNIIFAPEYYSRDFSDSSEQLSFNLSWTAASDTSNITHYVVYVHRYGPSSPDGVDVGLSTIFVLNGTVSELAYASVRVAAVHTDGSESFSERAFVPVYLPVDGPIGGVWEVMVLLIFLPALAVVVAILLLVRWVRKRSA